ncbi:hypothetical protein GA0070216_13525 [Micromonospora matsumotoense]|uniref:Uncharacterized protein n=1 Tax=Micromonospora matsumotoense TaxID=121616 RepID=A0A1C5AWC1_9ACTN|nr:hypothetical protein [Micromonospora matsumotoense]SCF49525.1 hypothetical protein GA0070216_13525 [Micromonospora matsumotoense]
MTCDRGCRAGARLGKVTEGWAHVACAAATITAGVVATMGVAGGKPLDPRAPGWYGVFGP